jgi:hypothetical protein
MPMSWMPKEGGMMCGVVGVGSWFGMTMTSLRYIFRALYGVGFLFSIACRCQGLCPQDVFILLALKQKGQFNE